MGTNALLFYCDPCFVRFSKSHRTYRIDVSRVFVSPVFPPIDHTSASAKRTVKRFSLDHTHSHLVTISHDIFTSHRIWSTIKPPQTRCCNFTYYRRAQVPRFAVLLLRERKKFEREQRSFLSSNRSMATETRGTEATRRRAQEISSVVAIKKRN